MKKILKGILKLVLPKKVRDIIRKMIRPEHQRYLPPMWRRRTEKYTERALKCAVICDELTYANLKSSVDVVFLSPNNWRTKLKRERPDLFFCEAAWEGLGGEWSDKIYRNRQYEEDNRSALMAILKYCQRAGVPTVFWNKEDTPEFAEATYNFIDTALLFDHIFTTCAECIPQYEARGHNSVHLMMFGYSPELFSETEQRPGNGVAVFLGSWYEANRERCEDMRQLFDAVLEQGLELRIYDRVSEKNWSDRQYPERYRPYILPAVPYEQTGEMMNGADYVLNINSVKDSETMFARRVFEAVACGRIVISNDSVGMEKIFPGGIWFVDQPFDRENEAEIIRRNKETVQKYTFYAQLEQAMCKIGIENIKKVEGK